MNKTMVGLLGSFAPFALTFALSTTALAQQDPAQAPPPPQAAPQVDYTQAPPAEPVAPPAQQRVYQYATGQWVYTDGDGWVWIPAGSNTTVVDGAPYAYLYTPSYGWTWYVSPWGLGAYHYGPWVAHPWRPLGWRGGWVAGPRIVGRLGRPGFYGHAGYHAGFARPGVGRPYAHAAHPGIAHSGYRAPAVHAGGTVRGGGGFHGGGHGGHR
jgi:hypothetical protein